MASVEHCLYCFESLAAHLEKRKALSLTDIQMSWAEYIKSLDKDADDAAEESSKSGKISKQIPALRRLAGNASSGSTSPSSASSISLAADTPGTSTSSLTEPSASTLITESPLFVTWNTISSRSGSRSLRGCIGTFESQSLGVGLSEYAITSAVHDMRFPPVELSELPSLEVAVTLLTDFEDCDDAMDWELGVHGLRISFFYHGKRYGATYLPDVATEQEWTKEETIVSLMRKAGWMGRKDKWQDIDLKCVRYQGKKESLEYSVYKQWRDWADKNTKSTR
jgi:AMME syndrome candidate gene 1 protein